MKSSNCKISNVEPEASAIVPSLWHWENVNGSPGVPRVNSLVTSASDTAVLDARSLSLDQIIF